MNYIFLLEKEELIYISHLISGKEIKKYFQKNSEKFTSIKPGFRPNGISDDEARSIIVQFSDRPFVRNFLNDSIDEWLQEIETDKLNLIEKGKNEEYALICTLVNSVFGKRVALYFKLKSLNCPENYIHTMQSAVDLIRERPINEDEVITKTEYLMQKEAWEKEKDSYLKEIKQTQKALVEFNQRMNDLHENLSKKEEVIKGLREEVSKYHRLDQYIENDTDDFYSSDLPFMSLCKVIKDNKGNMILRRLSDIENDTITGGYLEQTSSREYLYKVDGPNTEDYIGIWNWNAVPNVNNPSKDFIQSQYNENYLPIEVVIFNDCNDIHEIINRLKEGINYNAHSRRYYFAFWNGKTYEGVYISTKKVENTMGKIKLADDVFTAPLYLLKREDICIFGSCYLVKTIKMGRPNEIIYVTEPYEVVKKKFIQRITWTLSKQRGLTKNEFQRMKIFLQEFPLENLDKEIANTLQCDIDSAKEYIDFFIQQASTGIELNDIEDDILEQFVLSKPELTERYMSMLTEKWRKEHSEQILKLQQELEQVKDETKLESTRLVQIKQEFNQVNDELIEARSTRELQEQLATDVENRVAERIAQAKEDVAKFIVDQTFISQATVHNKEHVVAASFKMGEILPEDNLERYNTWEELLENLKYELLEAGVAEKYAIHLATFMYAATINHVPLLLAGPCAHEIANAFSSAICGCLAGVLDLVGEYSESIVKECLSSKSEVIIIKNLFSAQWNGRLGELLSKNHKQFIAIHPYVEDLQFEPKGLLNYMMPIFTELFVDKYATGNFVGGIKKTDFKEYKSDKTKKRHNTPLKMLRLSMYSRNFMGQVLEDMHGMLNDDLIDDDYMFVILPCAFWENNMEAIHHYIKQHPISAELSSIIEGYFGEI